MKQQSIDLRNEFQPATEEVFFDEETVQRIPAVVPLEETPTRASARFRRLRVPMRKEDKSFNPAFLIMALVAVTALGVIAGTLLYRTATDKSTNAAVETDEPVNRTIPAQYQFVVDKPDSTATTTKDSFSRDNLNSLPATSAPSKKDSRETEESSAPVTENEEQPAAEKEEAVEEPQIKAQSGSEDDDELPPPPPPRRDRKEDKKQNKAKQKNDNAKSEAAEEQPPTIDESSEN